MGGVELEPLEPEEAITMYLNDRRGELSDESIRKHRSRLKAFQSFLSEQGIDNLNDVSGRNLHRYRRWRREGRGDYEPVNTATLRSDLSTLRVFLDWCEAVDAVPRNMRDKVLVPKSDASRDDHVEAAQAHAILDYQDQYHYASKEHVVCSLMWETSARMGALHGLDVDDFDPDEPCLMFRHRPESDTPLKNGEKGERDVALDQDVALLLQDYIDERRNPITDEHGRQPLLTTTRGRMSRGYIRKISYRWTHPCVVDSCPHDRERASCEYRKTGHESKCPSALSPHAWRRGSLTTRLTEGYPAEIMSERSDVGVTILEQHYDERSERDRLRARKKLQDIIKAHGDESL